MWVDSESTVQVPGGAFDSLSSNTKLGKAVQEACDELDTLVTLVNHPSQPCRHFAKIRCMCFVSESCAAVNSTHLHDRMAPSP